MPTIPQILIVVSTPFLALLLGLLSYKFLNSFWHSAFFQVVVYVLTLLIGYSLTWYQELNGIEKNTHPLMNIYMCVETGILIKMISRLMEIKRNFVIIFVAFLVSFFANIFFSGFNLFANYAYATAGILITCIYSVLIYESTHSTQLERINNPVFWFSLGLVIYFACVVPYFSLFHYLNREQPQNSKKLFFFITDILANIRYLCLAIAFWLIRRNALKNPENAGLQ